ncbi:E3 ubiquitin-protein ligase parkin isoform X1 [Parasteatoda tepidariorum]|uniref:E3 ubiquitin-protein ligase parkin isoform X1 n=1 Tax=Parasteatoda tepidariorum TaxID=114398 RepID=UPI001C71957B|nr:E3 ubiquitin-protein ligase parkin isoform X1 [Parasteatoda tepidariorum]
MNFYEIVIGFIRSIMNIFISQRVIDTQKNYLKIFVKCGADTMVPVNVENNWTVGDLKANVASKLCLKAEDIRIIFSGKELHDDVEFQDCDVGEQSIIHAVPHTKKLMDISVENKCPLNQTPFCSDDFTEDKKTSPKSHFYVYCNDPCKSMHPGKLRVRCSSCKEGTLIVNQDPTCWEDVLVPGKINGVCQYEKCEGTHAEFYFKCTSHVSIPHDQAVPLYLIKNNFKSVPCIACTDTREIVLVFPCTSGHVICVDCFRLYCLSRLGERRFIQDSTIGYSIDCPAGCSDSLIKEPHHFKLLGEEEYSRYQRFGAEECLLQDGGVLCPQPNCGAGILPDTHCTRVVCSQNAGGCGFVFCKECMQGYHVGPCEPPEGISVSDRINYTIIDERASSSKWDEDSKKTIKVTTKPCPKCRTPTERDGGCMHMVCTRSQCGYHWCWVCQTEWTRECMGNHWFG